MIFVEGKANAVSDWLSRPPEVPIGRAYTVQKDEEEVVNGNPVGDGAFIEGLGSHKSDNDEIKKPETRVSGSDCSSEADSG